MSTERTSSAAWLKGVAEMFAAEGLDVPALFAEIGLAYAALDDPDARFELALALRVGAGGDQPSRSSTAS